MAFLSQNGSILIFLTYRNLYFLSSTMRIPGDVSTTSRDASIPNMSSPVFGDVAVCVEYLI